jgi:hypothetical protein
MIRLVGLWLVGCALCVTPVAADEDVYDGPTAVKPLTVTPQPQHSTRHGLRLRASVLPGEGWTRAPGSHGSPGNDGQAYRPLASNN